MITICHCHPTLVSLSWSGHQFFSQKETNLWPFVQVNRCWILDYLGQQSSHNWKSGACLCVDYVVIDVDPLTRREVSRQVNHDHPQPTYLLYRQVNPKSRSRCTYFKKHISKFRNFDMFMYYINIRQVNSILNQVSYVVEAGAF